MRIATRRSEGTTATEKKPNQLTGDEQIDLDALRHGISIRSNEQLARDQQRDRAPKTHGWYRDRVSVSGNRAPHAPPRARPRPMAYDPRVIRRGKTGGEWCSVCRGTDVDYMQQWCSEGCADGVGYICPVCERAVVPTRFRVCDECAAKSLVQET